MSASPTNPSVPAWLKMTAAVGLAAVGLSAATWSALSSSRPDLEPGAPGGGMMGTVGAGTPEDMRGQLAKRFGVSPESIRLDGQIGARERPAPPTGADAAAPAPRPPADFKDVSTPDALAGAQAVLVGAVTSATNEIKGLSDTPSATADLIAKAAAATLLSPLGGPESAEAGWKNLAPAGSTSEAETARSSLAKALATVLAGAKIDPAGITVSRFTPGTRPTGFAGPGGEQLAIIGMPLAQAFPDVANLDNRPAVLVRMPIQLADGTGAGKPLELAAVMAFDAASKTWQPSMMQVLAVDGADAMKIARGIRDARGPRPAPAAPPAAPKAG